MNIENKTFVVTGGGNGMGREIVLNLMDSGCNVIAVDISEEKLLETEKLSNGLRGKFSYSIVDISDSSSVCTWASSVLSSGLTVDGVINNAGIIQPFVSVGDIDYNVAHRIFNVNFWGMFNVVKVFLPVLKSRPEACVVNVSSMGGFLPIPGQAIYGASKAAVKLFSESLSVELEGSGVHVMTIFPGAMNTNIKANSGLVDCTLASAAKGEHNAKGVSPCDAAQIVVESIIQQKKNVCIGDDSKMMYKLCMTDPEEAVRRVASMINHKV